MAKKTIAKPIEQKQPSPAEILGKIAWLLMDSPQHQYLFLNDMEWLIRPPLNLRQFQLFENDNKAVGLVTWAYVSEDVEERLKKGIQKLRPADWNSGDNIWLIDVIAPYGNSQKILESIQKNIFENKQVKTFHHTEKGLSVVVLSELLNSFNSEKSDNEKEI